MISTQPIFKRLLQRFRSTVQFSSGWPIHEKTWRRAGMLTWRNIERDELVGYAVAGFHTFEVILVFAEHCKLMSVTGSFTGNDPQHAVDPVCHLPLVPSFGFQQESVIAKGYIRRFGSSVRTLYRAPFNLSFNFEKQITIESRSSKTIRSVS
jgi:hypothetical protein